MSLIGAILGAQTGTAQLAMALNAVRTSANNDQAIVQMLDAANQNAKAMLPQGVGTNIDITA